ncbi:FRG domain-containing protein [Macrococcoides canis]|uniref:FRG domain-containing protein n=1 Tax=Macrococcoides canis TaxID=1855823 RepID=UPI001AEC2334|nr:FRG domain-containing protein [Macrococcus canis]QTQ07521.1 FRG domain-containing protein [Macrococcus canis]
MKIYEILKIIIDESTKMKNNYFDNIGKNPVICYRGESKKYPTPLRPSFFRYQENFSFSDNNLLDLIVDNQIFTNDISNYINRAIDSQHYIALSKLLDISYNILPALYFACLDNHQEKEDGMFYIFIFPESYSSNSKYIMDYYSKSLKNPFTPYSSDFKLISHSKTNDRIRAQHGGFIFFPHNTFIELPKELYRTIVINKNDKSEILEELDCFFNISESTLFPEKDKQQKNVLNQLKVMSNKTSLELNEKDELIYFINLIELQLNQLSDTSIIRRKRFLRLQFREIENFFDNNNNLQPLIDDAKSYLINKYCI